MFKLNKIFVGNRIIWVVYFALVCISLIAVSSAGSTLTYRSGDYLSPLSSQFKFVILGLVVMYLFSHVPCRYYKIIPIVFLPLSWGLMALAEIFGTTVNGAQRWISIVGNVQFQPSEMAKCALVVGTALILANTQREKGADDRAFNWIMMITIPTILIIMKSNISTAILLGAVIFLMMILGRINWKILLKWGGIMTVGLGILAALVINLPRDSSFFQMPLCDRLLTAKTRLTSDPLPANPKDFDTDVKAQEAHANIAIASCNWVGKGPGNSDQRDFLSQAYSDFIYAIIIEEYGMLGALIVFLLYLFLLIQAGRIASRCERNFPAFLCMGFALLITIQAFCNMLVATGYFITGQPLPLISRGGTSFLANSFYFAVILSVSQTKLKTDDPYDPFLEKEKKAHDDSVEVD